MKTIPVKIGGKELRLAFTLDAMSMLQECVPEFDMNKLASYAKTPKGLADMVYVMAQQGELLEGRHLDVDRAWIGCHIAPSPGRIARIQIAVLNTLAEWMHMETEDDDEYEHDVTLEQIRKKETAAG